MGASGWRSRRSVVEQLAIEAHRFDFHQAVRLIEQLQLCPEGRSVGEAGNPDDEAVRFRSSMAPAFPASDLNSARPPRPGQPHWELEVNFMGLAGAFGPLPPPFTEEIIRRTRAGDTATRDFLDIFNHRLISLFHRVRQRHRPALTHRSPDQGPFADYLYALIGLNTEGLRGRMAVPDRALLNHAGLLAQQPRSQHGLIRLLQSHFKVPVRVEPLQGRWLALDDTQVTRLGGSNARLGAGAVLGRRAWDQQAAMTVALGPLDLRRFRTFLPGGSAWSALQGMIEFHNQATTTIVDIRLQLAADQVPALRLTGANRVALCTPQGLVDQPHAPAARLDRTARLLTRPSPEAPRLGWTTWLTTRPPAADKVVPVRGGTHVAA